MIHAGFLVQYMTSCDSFILPWKLAAFGKFFCSSGLVMEAVPFAKQCFEGNEGPQTREMGGWQVGRLQQQEVSYKYKQN